ncbi:MAG: FadR/GntR family transcriptional regulator [Alphaproteobacteria bacterium]
MRARLAGLIQSGELKVNDRLPSEIELARSFGVSRPVIREALVTLNALGLTTSQTGKGTFVASNRVRVPLLLGKYSPANLHEIRRFLEVPSARLAARRRTAENVVSLGEILIKVDREGDPARRNKLDAQFHIAIALATGNPLFVKLIEDLRAVLEEQSLTVSVMPNRRASATSEHRAIYEAIARGDAEAAGDAMAAHLDAVDVSLARLGEAGPAAGEAERAVGRGASVPPG